MPLFGSSAPTKVLVTGASGQTGSIVVRKLLEKDFQARALVRSDEKGETLKRELGEKGAKLEVFVGDISQPSASLTAAFEGIEALIIVTSAKPQLSRVSLAGVIFTKVFSLGMVSKKPSFWFEEGQSPQEIDYAGQVLQIDAAKKAGVKHIVLVSSMGGTKPDHFLNTQMDNIVLWKRKAETYLRDSGVAYTIIHPGGLLPHYGDKNPAPGGRRELILAIDDALMNDTDPTKKKSLVPREDVAEVCVQSLVTSEAKGRAFDLGSGAEAETEIPVDLQVLLQNFGKINCNYTKADELFDGTSSDKSMRSCVFCSNQE